MSQFRRTKKFSSISLRAISDESLIRLLIQISRERFDPAIVVKSSQGDAEIVILELLCRLEKVNKLHEKLCETLTCPRCGATYPGAP